MNTKHHKPPFALAYDGSKVHIPELTQADIEHHLNVMLLAARGFDQGHKNHPHFQSAARPSSSSGLSARTTFLGKAIVEANFRSSHRNAWEDLIPTASGTDQVHIANAGTGTMRPIPLKWGRLQFEYIDRLPRLPELLRLSLFQRIVSKAACSLASLLLKAAVATAGIAARAGKFRTITVALNSSFVPPG